MERVGRPSLLVGEMGLEENRERGKGCLPFVDTDWLVWVYRRERRENNGSGGGITVMRDFLFVYLLATEISKRASDRPHATDGLPAFSPTPTPSLPAMSWCPIGASWPDLSVPFPPRLR